MTGQYNGDTMPSTLIAQNSARESDVELALIRERLANLEKGVDAAHAATIRNQQATTVGLRWVIGLLIVVGSASGLFVWTQESRTRLEVAEMREETRDALEALRLQLTRLDGRQARIQTKVNGILKASATVEP